MIEKFFTTEQVANILQMHPFTILKFIREGKLKGLKLGRVYRIKESDVKEFLESKMTNSKSIEQKPKRIKAEKKNPTRNHYDLDQEKEKDKEEGEHYYTI